MPKFFNAKDVDFIKTIAEEVVDYVVEQAVTLFKVSVGETKTNLYGESLGKVWRAPSTLMAIVDREPINVVYEGFGADRQGAVEFRFNIHRLREESYSVPKVRDINGTLVPTEAIQNVQVGYPQIGDVIQIIPNHACVVSNLFDRVFLRHPDGRIEVQDVACRGQVW